jgi:hypothetical protein
MMCPFRSCVPSGTQSGVWLAITRAEPAVDAFGDCSPSGLKHHVVTSERPAIDLASAWCVRRAGRVATRARPAWLAGSRCGITDFAAAEVRRDDDGGGEPLSGHGLAPGNVHRPNSELTVMVCLVAVLTWACARDEHRELVCGQHTALLADKIGNTDGVSDRTGSDTSASLT